MKGLFLPLTFAFVFHWCWFGGFLGWMLHSGAAEESQARPKIKVRLAPPKPKPKPQPQPSPSPLARVEPPRPVAKPRPPVPARAPQPLAPPPQPPRQPQLAAPQLPPSRPAAALPPRHYRTLTSNSGGRPSRGPVTSQSEPLNQAGALPGFTSDSNTQPGAPLPSGPAPEEGPASQPEPQAPAAPPSPEPTPPPPPSPSPSPSPSASPSPPVAFQTPALPKGLPNRPATPVGSPPQVRMPEDLRRNGGKTFVWIEIQISAEGSTQVRLLTPSGSSELDQKIVETLATWRWEPAIQEGQPSATKERFKLEFEVG